MQIYTPMYRRSHCFDSSTTKTQNKKNTKAMLFSAFFILFSWNKLTSKKDYSDLNLKNCQLTKMSKLSFSLGALRLFAAFLIIDFMS